MENRDFSTEDVVDTVTLLQMIPTHGDGIGWYLLERILALRGHSISLDGKLITLLKKLEGSGFIEPKLVTESPHPKYVLTHKGKEWLESQQVRHLDAEN